MRTWFYAIVGLQIIFLLGEAGTAHIGLSSGQLVRLRVVPVDPRSLFMGRYMALSYDISTIDLSTVAHPEPIATFDRGTTVYVGLTPRRPWAAPHSVTTRPPTGNSTTPYLRGRIRSYHGNVIQVEYGLERYFIPEGKEQEVNRLRWGRQGGGERSQVTVEVSVGKDGRGLIRRVLVDGEPLPF